jgi:hypothetical protein
MAVPPRWSEAELARRVVEATAIFREERLSEPLEKWVQEFDSSAADLRRLFAIRGIIQPIGLRPEDVVAIFAGGLGDVFRYLAGPPISADDLETLAGVSSLSTPALAANGFAAAGAICDIFRRTVDPRRFPWISEAREPSANEVDVAIASSAALIAGQRVQTGRRTASKNAQEEAVKVFLRSLGFHDAPTPRRINTLDDAPPRGHFCSEALVGTRKADVPVRLYDGRLMPIECKVSNSALNSIKRINNDAAVKAGLWLHEFGARQIVPVAVLSGVFDVGNLVRAQEGSLTLFWSHRLDQMREFIESTKA